VAELPRSVRLDVITDVKETVCKDACKGCVQARGLLGSDTQTSTSGKGLRSGSNAASALLHRGGTLPKPLPERSRDELKTEPHP